MFRFFRNLLLFLLLWPTLMTGGAGAEEQVDEIRQNLEKIERRIARTSKSLAEKQSREKSLSTDLKAVEGDLAGLRRRIAAQNERLASVTGEMAAVEKKIARQRKAAEGVKTQLNQRLVALYKGGEMGLLRALFGAGNLARMAEDYDYLGRIARRDRELLDSYRRRLDELNASLDSLSALRRDQEQLVADGRRDQETLRKAAQLKKRLLGQTQKDQGQLAAELATLRERAGRLAQLVRKLESPGPREDSSRPAPAPSSASPFGRQKGRLPRPASGKIVVGFGTGRSPELGTLYESNGIEIRAAQNQPIAAVWAGKVVFASEFKGYGKLLIVDHGGNYFTLYAQAARLAKKVGEGVRRGEALAFSGSDTVYFEIRHRGVPLDPAAWLTPR